ncbi:acyltransferase family protein [Salinibacterium sp. G-O1]|uniref:acyltransferase family protein n=1 Tax=Salinibacterium sp. G-O1 TaxID=3046208 RepID=UPI0024BB4A75|nr:acyltransferase family protein [Salinibacterium sp. G-O1]MDJ0334619.1 acyltransferase family protein [Salinibacterium sp. G-O1]
MTTSAPVIPASTTKKRVPMWDNARFLAVTLVVVGHSIQRLTGASDSAYVVYLLIYSFHMPAFAVISGYFSKPGPPNASQMKRVLTDILLPYFIMEAIWTVVQFVVTGSQDFNPTKASWTLWFLLALAIFRLVLPYLALVRFPLLLSVVLSIGVGYFSNVDSTFSLSRAIGILPFFVLGWQLKGWGFIDRWNDATARASLWIRGGAVLVFGVWIAVIVLNVKEFKAISLHHWFFYDDSYSGMDATVWWAGAVRLGGIVLTTILIAAFIVLIPRRNTAITAWGQATMYIYLLHTFVLYPLRQSDLLKGDDPPALLLPGMILAGIVIALVLGTPIVRRIFRPLVEPRAAWLFVDKEGLKS